jgi:hypothetical protein
VALALIFSSRFSFFRGSFTLCVKSGGDFASVGAAGFALKAKLTFEEESEFCRGGGILASFAISSSTCKSFEGRKGLSSSSSLAWEEAVWGGGELCMCGAEFP